jgi:curved DNA-binding protein CbpA
MKYFKPIPKTAEELKKLYKKLSLKHHPDVGGTDEAMKTVNAEYTALFEKLKDIHTNASGETYRKTTQETPQQFIEIIDRLIKFDGIVIEIIGSFVWVSANTKPYKDELKSMGFKWSQNKLSWYLAPKDYRRHSKKVYNLDEIRLMFGSQEVETKPQGKKHYKKLSSTI